MAEEANRTLELSFGEHLPMLNYVCGGRKLWEAVGYLSTWAASSDRYRHCRIIGGVYGDTPELIATYWKEPHSADNVNDNPITYQLGAVWRPDGGPDGTGDFSFHS
jgi:hypothetical protein